MSDNRRIVVNLEPPKTPQPAAGQKSVAPSFKSSFGQAEAAAPPKKGRLWLKILLALGALLILVAIGTGIYGYWWWTSLQKSPSYSLALLVDAARKDDQKTVDELLDANSVVDNFVPQIKEKAKERYGRGFPPDKVRAAEQLLTQYLNPILPGIKERSRKEIPRVIKERTQSVPQVSPWIMATGINRLVTIQQSGDTATVKGTLQQREVEMTMQKIDGNRWKIVSVQDPALADKIANEVAQRILSAVNKKPGEAQRQAKGAIDDLRKQIEQLVTTP